MAFFVYIVASSKNGTLYAGSTDEIGRRIWEHKEKLRPGFTAKYGVSRLVWYEAHETRDAAFRRERRIKKWNRVWKLELIETSNPEWLDLFETLPPLIL
ncbi:MAG: GIY-YIG nuclease [Caulobacterales bacterium 32-69-10]|nr:MAG: GIY-YIG nuclease [Caulobacterales bacterium 32-69-10]